MEAGSGDVKGQPKKIERERERPDGFNVNLGAAK